MARHVRELFELSGQKALVTGGLRGLGLQLAEALGEAGATVLLTSRKESDLAQAAAHLRARGIEVAFFAGKYITGHTLAVDGGYGAAGR
jgi:nucleoside-diphosphate-sugar epimerase